MYGAAIAQLFAVQENYNVFTPVKEFTAFKETPRFIQPTSGYQINSGSNSAEGQFVRFHRNRYSHRNYILIQISFLAKSAVEFYFTFYFTTP